MQLFTYWNERVNLISRKDIQHLEEHHILHSLGIAKAISFKAGSRVADLGTGGGLPALPLAILFPDTLFVPVDSIGKKIRVVSEMAKELKLANVEPVNSRFENVPQTFDFVVSRAVAPFHNLLQWTKGKVSPAQRNDLPNGLLCLKGLSDETQLIETGYPYHMHPLSDYFREAFFATKAVFHVAL